MWNSTFAASRRLASFSRGLVARPGVFGRSFTDEAPKEDPIVDWKRVGPSLKQLIGRIGQNYVKHLEDQLSGTLKLTPGYVGLCGAGIGAGYAGTTVARSCRSGDEAFVLGSVSSVFGGALGLVLAGGWAICILPLSFGSVSYLVWKATHVERPKTLNLLN